MSWVVVRGFVFVPTVLVIVWAFVWQAGHWIWSESIIVSDQFLRCEITETIYGITSPDLCSRTQSWMRISLFCIKSILWRDTRLIVTPESAVGVRCATGVRMPVRPTCRSICSICVAACWAGNLYAIARRGWWLVDQRSSLISLSASLITNPSKSTSAWARLSLRDHCSINVLISSIVYCDWVCVR